jgi:hypothetical protein
MRIGQKIKEEKIGALSHSSGVITLAPSTVNIGGLQIDTDSLNRTIATDVTMTANSLYMIYAVLSGGVPVLRISSNVNSIGPAGFTSWKLVGAFYANGETSVAFGSFVNLEGVPTTNWKNYVPTGAWTTFTTYTGRWRRVADSVEIDVVLNFSGAPGGPANLTINMPTNLVIDSAKLASSSNARETLGSATILDSGARVYLGNVTYATTTTVEFTQSESGGSGQITTTAPITFGASDAIGGRFTVPIVNFSNIQLKDL